jgi:hydrogenase-4 component E
VNQAVTWALVISALGVVTVRRRSVAIVLVAVQSLWLGAEAISDAAGHSTALLVGGAVLVAKAVVLPGLLAAVVLRTREAGRISSERHPLARLTIALAIALAIAALVPRFGLVHPGVEHAAVGLVALGITTAVLRRPTVFQVLGFLVAENGLYLAALSAPGGLPAFIELGLVFDLVVVVSVAGVFSAKIHEQLGTGDTSLLAGLRD